MKLVYGVFFLILCQPSLALSSFDVVAMRSNEVNDSGMRTRPSEIFLRDNLKKKGVNVTKSGLQYEVLQKGKSSIKPKFNDVVKVNYRGTLIDGTVFEETYSSGRPTMIYIDKAFPGWAEGLQLMEVGSKLKLVIPPELAYGKRQLGQKIGPNSVLIFELELLEIIDRDKLEENKKSPIDPSNVDLTSPKKAARSFLILFTNVIPAFTDKDIRYTCEAIAADIYMKECQSFFGKRLLSLQKTPIARAFFDHKFIGEAGPKNNDIAISWQEQIEFTNGKKLIEAKKIRLLFLNQNGEWRVKSAAE